MKTYRVMYFKDKEQSPFETKEVQSDDYSKLCLMEALYVGSRFFRDTDPTVTIKIEEV